MFPGTDSSILTLTGTSSKQSIMVKTMQSGNDDMIEIPLDVPIKVQCLQTNTQLTKNEATMYTYQSIDNLQNLPYMSASYDENKQANEGSLYEHLYTGEED